MNALSKSLYITFGYLVLLYFSLLVSYLVEQHFSISVWLSSLLFAPLSVLTVYFFVKRMLEKIDIAAENNGKQLSGEVFTLPYRLTVYGMIFSVFIFFSEIIFDGFYPDVISEAFMMSLFLGSYLYFGYETAFFSLKEKGYYPHQKYGFLGFRMKLMILLISFSLIPFLVLLIKYYMIYQRGIHHGMPVDDVSDSILWGIVSVFLRTAVAATFTGYYFSRSFTHPVQQLKDAFRLIEDGHKGISVPVYTGDELGILSNEFNEMTFELDNRDRLQKLFGVNVGRDAADFLVSENVHKRGQKIELTLLQIHLHQNSFEPDSVIPEDMLDNLNRYTSLMVRIIESNRGQINRITGNTILAMFGAPAPVRDTNHRWNAIKAGRDLIKGLADFNDNIRVESIPAFRMGIGVHTGYVILGVIGSRDRTEYTITGNPIYMTEWIENATTKLNTPLLISSDTYEYGDHKYDSYSDIINNNFRVYQVRIKGMEKITKLYGPS